MKKKTTSKAEKAKAEALLIGVGLLLCALLIGYAIRKTAKPAVSGSVETASFATGDTASQRKKETVALQDKLFGTPSGMISSATPTDPAGRIDLNAATAEDLMTVEGIGAKRAEAIVAYREKNGPFTSVDDLLKVSGIGEKTLALLRDRFYCE